MLVIRDPIHKQIAISESERKLIRTKLFQRLQDIKHLSLAYKKFPSAMHTRFSHSLGVMHLCGLVFERLEKYKKIDPKFKIKIRVAGALHDIGQGPYSHLTERITGFDHEKATILFIEHDEEIGKVLTKDFKFDKTDIEQITSLIVGDKDRFNELVGNSDFEFLTEVLNGPLDVDKLDYLQRDSYFTGVGFGTSESLMLLNNLVPKDGSIVIEDGGIYAAEMLMVSRLEMYQAVYMNENIRARETAVVEAFRIIEKYDLVNDISKYNYYNINIPPNVPLLFAFSDIALKMQIKDAKDILSENNYETKISDVEKTLINYCYNTLWDQAIPKEEEFTTIFENKIDNIKSAIIRKKLYRLMEDDKNFKYFEEAVKEELEAIYLFSWDNIPGNDDHMLKEYLNQKFDLDWIKTAKIEKTGDNKTIKVFNEINCVSLTLNEKKTMANIEIENVRTEDIIIKMENDELNVYEGIKIPKELILVDRTKFAPYGIKKDKFGDEPIIKLNKTETRNLSKISYISKSLKDIPVEPLRIFIPNKYCSKNHYLIKKVIEEKFGEYIRSTENTI